jgi:hypothetical protein
VIAQGISQPLRHTTAAREMVGHPAYLAYAHNLPNKEMLCTQARGRGAAGRAMQQEAWLLGH